MENDVQEAVESAKAAQSRAIQKLNGEIDAGLSALADRVKTMRSIDLAGELDNLAGLIRARHYLKRSTGE